MDVIETIKANLSSVLLSVIYNSNDYDVDGSGEEDNHLSDKDDLIKDERYNTLITFRLINLKMLDTYYYYFKR